MMKKRLTLLLSLSALFAALITAVSFIHLPLPSKGGYFHPGDSVIYLSACLLPFPFGAVAAAIGGVLCDFLSSVPVWAPFTFVIKFLNTLPFYALALKKKSADKIFTAHSAAAAAVSGVITIVLYFLSSRVVYGSFAAAAADLPGNAVQACASLALFLIAAAALDRAKIKSKFFTFGK